MTWGKVATVLIRAATVQQEQEDDNALWMRELGGGILLGGPTHSWHQVVPSYYGNAHPSFCDARPEADHYLDPAAVSWYATGRL